MTARIIPGGFPGVPGVPETGDIDLAEMRRIELGRGVRTEAFPAASRTRELYTGPATGDQFGALEVLAALGGRQATRAKPATRGPRRVRLPASWPLIAILAAQAVLSLRLVWSNTAFQDEALYLSAGHWEIAHLLHGTHIPQYQTYFSGAPVIYPILGAMADSLGGLAAARILSCLFMLGATALCYGTASRLLGRRAAIAAAAVFAALGPAEFLGAFATYDAMALFLLALSAFLVVRACGWYSEPLLIIAALILALGDATKYATALWDPVVITLVILTARNSDWVAGIMRGIRFTAYLAGIIAVALDLAGHSYVQGVMFTTVARRAGGAYASLWLITRDTSSWIGPAILLAAAGVAVAWRDGPRARWLCAILFAATLLAPLHQAQIHTTVSLYKHVGYGAWFGAFPAGLALAKAGEVNARKGWRVAAVTAGLIAMGSAPQVTGRFAMWPDVSGMMPVLAGAFQRSGCPCLVAQSNVAGYYLADSGPSEFTGPYYFAWRDPVSGQFLTGLPAYADAVKRGFFKVIEIDPDEDAQVYRSVTQALTTAPRYRLAWSEHIGGGVMQVWERKP